MKLATILSKHCFLFHLALKYCLYSRLDFPVQFIYLHSNSFSSTKHIFRQKLFPHLWLTEDIKPQYISHNRVPS